MTGRDLSGRRIVVLGGTGNLGRAVTGRLRDDGASVLVADARPPTDETRHPEVEYTTVDVLDEASVAAAFALSVWSNSRWAITLVRIRLTLRLWFAAVSC